MSWKEELDRERRKTDCDYVKEIYNDVEELMNVFVNQGHSGFSAKQTIKIFFRVANNLPLTAITDEDFAFANDGRILDDPTWLKKAGLKDNIQCPRYTALFKKIHLDGTVTYSDVNRAVGIDEDDLPYSSGLESKLVDEMFPITLPYYPSPEETYKVYTEHYLLDEKNGDYDVKHINSIVTPDGEKIPVDRWWHEKDGKMQEVTDANEIKELAMQVAALQKNKEE